MIPDKFFTGEIWRTETFPDFIERYGENHSIDKKNYSQEKFREYKDDYFTVCENNLSPLFHRKNSYYNGKKFTILERFDYLSFPAWIIKFENGTKEIAIPNDVCNRLV